MVHQELSNYVLEQLRSGYSDHDIIDNLVQMGYPQSMVHEAHQHAKRQHLGVGPAPAPRPLPGGGALKTIQEPEAATAPAAPGAKPSSSAKLIDLIKDWLMSLVKPRDVFERLKTDAKWVEGGVRNVLLAGIVVGLIMGVAALLSKDLSSMFSAFSSAGSSSLSSLPTGDSTWMLKGMTFIMLVGVMPVYTFLSWMVWTSITYFSALAVGGKGTFSKHSSLISVYFSGAVILITLVFLTTSICAISISLLAVGFLTLYPLTFAMKSAHEVDTMKAVLIWLIPVIIILLLTFPILKGYLSATKMICFPPSPNIALG
jgi:hypothetical protein